MSPMEKWDANPRQEWNSGEELLHCSGSAVGTKLSDYWRWRGSNLLDNIERGFFAEFLVAKSLGLVGETRREWGAFDLKLPDLDGGEGTKIEVKSSAHLQSWPQERDSTISFRIAPIKFEWNALQNCTIEHKMPVRPSDIYVFCHFTPCIHAWRSADPLNVDQWDFYVLATKKLDCELRDQKSTGLKTLEKLTGGLTRFRELETRIKEVAAKIRSERGC